MRQLLTLLLSVISVWHVCGEAEPDPLDEINVNINLPGSTVSRSSSPSILQGDDYHTFGINNVRGMQVQSDTNTTTEDPIVDEIIDGNETAPAGGPGGVDPINAPAEEVPVANVPAAPDAPVTVPAAPAPAAPAPATPAAAPAGVPGTPGSGVPGTPGRASDPALRRLAAAGRMADQLIAARLARLATQSGLLGRAGGLDYHEFGVNNVETMNVEGDGSGSGSSLSSLESGSDEAGNSDENGAQVDALVDSRGGLGLIAARNSINPVGADYHEFGINYVDEMNVAGRMAAAARNGQDYHEFGINTVDTMNVDGRMSAAAAAARNGQDYHEFGINDVQEMNVAGRMAAAAAARNGQDYHEFGINTVDTMNVDGRMAAAAAAARNGQDYHEFGINDVQEMNVAGRMAAAAAAAAGAGIDYHTFGINSVRGMNVEGDGAGGGGFDSAEDGLDSGAEEEEAILESGGDSAGDLDPNDSLGSGGVDQGVSVEARHEFGINTVDTMNVESRLAAARMAAAAAARAGVDYHEFGINNVDEMNVASRMAAAARAGVDYHEFGINDVAEMNVDGRNGLAARTAGQDYHEFGINAVDQMNVESRKAAV